MPTGGGAIRGMGETFAATPVTGTGSLTVPIFTSPGRAGFGPRLSLSYDSGAGNGPFGFGWSLALPAVTRKTDKGVPRYLGGEEADAFILSGAEDLVPELVESVGQWQRPRLVRTVAGVRYDVQRYRPRVEGLFSRIEQWTNPLDPADSSWRSISRDNVTSWYGKAADSRIADPADPGRIYSWLLCQSHDDKGNVVVYGYKSEDSEGVDHALAHERNRTDASRAVNRYLKRITYGNRTPYLPTIVEDLTQATLPAEWLFEVVFDYGEHDAHRPAPAEAGPWPVRHDPFSTYRPGFEVRTYRLCRRVLMFHRFVELGEAPCLVRSTDFTYSDQVDPRDGRYPRFSFMRSATQSGYRREVDGSTVTAAMPPLEFEYSQPIIGDEIRDVDPVSLENLPCGLDGTRYQWVDLDGEGLSGILTEQGGDWYYKRNLSPAPDTEDAAARFGPTELVASKPAMGGLDGGRSQFMDLAGDGRLDLVQLDGPMPGFFERTSDAEWEPFVPFETLPVVDWGDPNLRLVDLTGDGRADILISEDDAFCWHPSLAEVGFGPSERVVKVLDEEHGPDLVFADRTQSIYLADMSGDGLTDLLRIRNGEVCYWPNLGYGRFGAKVTMDGAPWFDHPDLFAQRRIRTADVDGSGATDLIYLADDGARCYFNQSGNGWSEAQRLTAFPAVDDLSSVQVLDLLGNGTACLVWSSPVPGDGQRPMRYLDLMGGQKPHLLTRWVNNLGAETTLHYATSTSFYLADAQAGNPWITRVPFPVHVVDRVESLDRISGNRFVTRYAYHHGHFDGVEREFRGFGMVEQSDTEAFAALGAVQPLPIDAALEAASHVPPVLTRTWFHTGVYLGRQHVSDFFAGLLGGDDTGEYYREPDLTGEQARHLLLEDTVLPTGLSLDEEREACRALRGAMLRQEVYALDGTEQETQPYAVAEQNFTVRVLQPMAGNRHAVFLTQAREAIAYQYERDASDPRIAHALTLEVDDFGGVLKSAAIGYGRRLPDLTLPAADQEEQTRLRVTYVEAAFTNSIEFDDAYRSPAPSEARTYELTGLPRPAGNGRFTFDQVLAAGTAAAPLAYEQKPEARVLRKRLIEHARTRYRPDDLGAGQRSALALLPLGSLEPRALPGEGYTLALTPGLVAQVYGGKVTDAMLESDGRYVHSEGDASWWIPSGRMFLAPGADDSPATELAHARAHFFLPHRFRDPFHTAQLATESVVSYDAYDLLVQETRDALGNRITVGERDAAGNLTAPGHDYRVLQPALVMDANRNRAAAVFDALGLVVGTAVMGKPLPAPVEGDSLDGFAADLSEAVVLDHLSDPLSEPQAILGRATARLVYDQFAYRRTKDLPHPQPAVVYALARETHDGEPVPADGLKLQHGFSYSDGFGRVIQQKARAEPGPLVGGGSQSDPRWVGSGWTMFNNKGQPVRRYEPFFTATHRFEFDVRRGVSPILFYDPLQRVVATLNPDHTWQKVVFDPWRQDTWDANDTVLQAEPQRDLQVGDFFARLPGHDYLPTWHAARSGGGLGAHELAAATKTAVHAATPSVAHLDSLGRTFLTIAHNTLQRSTSPADTPPEETFQRTRIVFDIEGNQREVIDALERVVMRSDYDMLGNQVHTESMEAGERWMLNDVAGRLIRAWDGRGHAFRTEYDALRRPLRTFVSGGDGAQSDPRVLGREVMFTRIEYGEGQADDTALNLRTRVCKLRDGAGIVTSEGYDFKGNLLRGSRRLARDYQGVPDWAGEVALEADSYTSSTTYDALNRPVAATSPDGSVIRPGYNEASLLEGIDANLRGETLDGEPVWTPFVTDIDYNAEGQRERIVYGNGASTQYTYDPLTFRLLRLFTGRSATAFPDDCPSALPIGWPGCAVQNLTYSYDPVGNITHVQDDAQQTIYFRNRRVGPSNDYVYDATYQLVEATGREHLGQINGVPTAPDAFNGFHTNLSHPSDGTAMGSYGERYVYDAAGNFLQLSHQATGGSWTRDYTYAERSQIERGNVSNRLSATQVGSGRRETYTYDAHGSTTRMPHLPAMQWTFLDQLRASSKQAVGDGTPETTYYVYDAAGQRVRKVTERRAAAGDTARRKHERVYLGGFEVYREYAGDGVATTLERETLHVMDDKQRVAMVETRTQRDDGSAARLTRFQIGNHLGSSSVELDEAGRIISYEEFYPYGSTSYQAVDASIKAAAKRYRSSGTERDEETGLTYHGARYLAPWIGRWSSADPAGMVDGPNLYVYASGHPTTGIDTGGMGTEEFENSVGVLESQLWRNEQLNGVKDDNGLRDKYVDNTNVTLEQLARAIIGHKEGGIGATETARSIRGITAAQWQIGEAVYLDQEVATTGVATSQEQWLSTLRGASLDAPRANVFGAVAQYGAYQLTGDVATANQYGAMGAGLGGPLLALGAALSNRPNAPATPSEPPLLPNSQFVRGAWTYQPGPGSTRTSVGNRLGEASEVFAASLAGGTRSGERVKTGKGSTDIDAVGRNREIVQVGQAAKENNLSGLGTEIAVLKEVAASRGVGLQYYFSSDASPRLIEFTARRIGIENVFLFPSLNVSPLPSGVMYNTRIPQAPRDLLNVNDWRRSGFLP